jgi:hypothetical protein
MHLGWLLGLLFAAAFALVFWEYQAIHDLEPWAVRTAVRMFTHRGTLPDRHFGGLTAPSGFRLRSLGSGRYLVRALEWNEPGARTDAPMPWAVALVRVRGREWTLEGRFGIGIVVVFVAGVGFLLTRATVDHFTPVGWAGALGWSAWVLLSFVAQRRKMWRAFSRFTISAGLEGGV